jgi:hypothetical protein
MNITYKNRSKLPAHEADAIIEFMAARFPDVGLPVRVTIVGRQDGEGVWGRAYWPINRKVRRVIKAGEYAAHINVGQARRYPYTWTYKKRAGPRTANSLLEEFVHTLAHELQHVVQFAGTEAKVPNWRRTTTKRKFWTRWRPRQSFFAEAATRFCDVYKLWCEYNCESSSGEVNAELVAKATLNAWRSREIVGVNAVKPTGSTP